MRSKKQVTAQDVKNAYYQKTMGVGVVSLADLSEGFHEPPRKHVESKEVPWETPLIEGE